MKTSKFLLSVALLVGFTALAYADYDDGKAAYDRGDWAKAYKEFEAAAEQSNAKAQFCLGLLYENGLGVPKDFVRAYMWINLAAAQGELFSILEMDALSRKMTPSQIAEAQGLDRKWTPICPGYTTAYTEFTPLSKLGYSPQTYLGAISCAKGNNAELLKWYRKALEEDDRNGAYNLGNIYERGRGVPRDFILAYMFYSLAAMPGNLALMSMNELEKKMTPAQLTEARRLAGTWAPQHDQGASQDNTEAYRKAADQGDAEAQWRLGLAYRQGKGVSQDDTEAMKWFRKAAEQGNIKAQCSLGNMYIIGEAVPKDYIEAMKWFRKAAEQGDDVGQYDLGEMYYQGKGVPKDFVQALMWWNLSANQSNPDARMNMDIVQEKMTPAQIAEAQRLAMEWKPTGRE